MNSTETYKIQLTIRKSINTNGNTEGIFLSVNFRRFLPTKIYPQYIPRELQWEKNNLNKKNDDVLFFTNGMTNGINSVSKMLTLFIMSLTDGITNENFHWYFLESYGIVHSPIALLIAVF